MNTHDQRIDRTGWAPGPWDGEQDREEFRTRSGLPGLILRNRNGALCGYVAIRPGHPAYGKRYRDLEVTVHGGLTYAAPCQGHICHVPARGEPDDVYWLGFDCGHAWDVSPGLDAYFRQRGMSYLLESDPFWARYRTIDYVREECEKLAAQLAGMA